MGHRENQADNGAIVKPVTVLFLFVIFTSVLLSSTALVYWLMFVMSLAVLTSSDRRKAGCLLLAYGVLYLFVFLMHRYIRAFGWFGAIYTMALIITKLYPLWLLCAAIISYNTSETMNSLRALKLPNHICISVSIFFRFLPEYINYFKDVKEGLRVRGISFDIRKPRKSVEVYIVPMINKAFKTGEVITGSLITKGIEYDCKKTSYREIQPKLLDYVIAFMAICLLGVNLWMKFFR